MSARFVLHSLEILFEKLNDSFAYAGRDPGCTDFHDRQHRRLFAERRCRHVAHGFVVIPKSSNPERIRSNAAGARIELSADEVTAIDALAR